MQVQKQLFTDNRMTVHRFWKNPRKTTVVESFFSTVTDLATLLKQDPTTGVFVKTFQNFQNIYFLCNTSTAASEFIDSSYSFCPVFPALFVFRDKRGRRVQYFMLEVLLAKNALRI